MFRKLALIMSKKPSAVDPQAVVLPDDRICRAPNGAEIVKKWKKSKYVISTLYPGTAESETVQNLVRMSLMHKGALALLIPQLWGMEDATVTGKYQAASVFVFQFRGETIICAAEQGGRGTAWEWLREENDQGWGQPMTSTSPEAAHFWPAFCRLFLDQLHAHLDAGPDTPDMDM